MVKNLIRDDFRMLFYPLSLSIYHSNWEVKKQTKNTHTKNKGVGEVPKSSEAETLRKAVSKREF